MREVREVSEVYLTPLVSLRAQCRYTCTCRLEPFLTSEKLQILSFYSLFVLPWMLVVQLAPFRLLPFGSGQVDVGMSVVDVWATAVSPVMSVWIATFVARGIRSVTRLRLLVRLLVAICSVSVLRTRFLLPVSFSIAVLGFADFLPDFSAAFDNLIPFVCGCYDFCLVRL